MKVLLVIAAAVAGILAYRYYQCKKAGNINCSIWTGMPRVANGAPNVSVAGKVDLWCENGKYYKRTSTAVYGVADKLELTKPEFDALVAQGISYSNCPV